MNRQADSNFVTTCRLEETFGATSHSWLKQVQNDLDSHKLVWTESVNLAQNWLLWSLLRLVALRTRGSVCWRWWWMMGFLTVSGSALPGWSWAGPLNGFAMVHMSTGLPCSFSRNRLDTVAEAVYCRPATWVWFCWIKWVIVGVKSSIWPELLKYSWKIPL